MPDHRKISPSVDSRDVELGALVKYTTYHGLFANPFLVAIYVSNFTYGIAVSDSIRRLAPSTKQFRPMPGFEFTSQRVGLSCRHIAYYAISDFSTQPLS